MSKQDPGKALGLPPPQFAYGAPLQQQYGSQPPPYSAVPPSQPGYGGYGAPVSHAGGYPAQVSNPYAQQQYVQMPHVQQVPRAPDTYAPSSAYPRQQYMPVVQPQAMAHPGPPPPYTPMAQPMMMQQPQTVVVGGAFDAGARFDGISQPGIPPPPPGVAPNAAQMARMQGHNVVATQQRSNWFTGGSGGGATLF